ncbi:MAG: hypothetical protein S4CHLAM102_01220 [Chlamydiia bacterium]|nr:hypothetical protein [Chlamydiia bacterium]
MSDSRPDSRLRGEKSIYLQQAASSLVDWYPWGMDAVEQAKQDQKPIFLSIGYSACHWCHVQDRDSFCDAEVAELLNTHFICIKVDKEELSPVDHIYMDSASALIAQPAGWPLLIFLSHDLEPFYATTYIPRESSADMMGMCDVLNHMIQVWNSDERELLFVQAKKVSELLVAADQLPPQGEEGLNPESVEQAFEKMIGAFDPIHGGLFATAKFPMGMIQIALLNFAKQNEEARVQYVVELTLDHMMNGGIYDQLGSGFHRYATDRAWNVPHFEKMLYDNATMMSAYTAAGVFMGKEDYLEVASQLGAFIEKEMSAPEGGFGSSLDAGDIDDEGAFYKWSLTDLQTLLPEKELFIALNVFGLSDEGSLDGRGVLLRNVEAESFRKQQGIEADQFESEVASIRQKLLSARESRPRPTFDDKVITGWNGAAIDSFAMLGRAIRSDHFIEVAVRTADWLWENCYLDRTLYRRFREGQARFDGSLEDYAFTIKGFLSLFEVTGRQVYFDRALELVDKVIEKFSSDTPLFYYSVEDPLLILRRIEVTDGAEPSGNALMCEIFTRLYLITSDEEWRGRAESMLELMTPRMMEYPVPSSAFYNTRLLLDDELSGRIVIYLTGDERATDEIQDRVATNYMPHQVCVMVGGGSSLSIFGDYQAVSEPTLLHVKLDQERVEVKGVEAIADYLNNI